MTNREIADEMMRLDDGAYDAMRDRIEHALDEAEQRGLRNALASGMPVAAVVTHSPNALAFARLEAKIEALEWAMRSHLGTGTSLRLAIKQELDRLRAELEKLQ